MKNTSKNLQENMDRAWYAAYKSRPLYENRSRKLNKRWDRLNDFTFTDKFNQLTDEQQKAVFDKLDKIDNELNCIEAVLDCIEKIMSVSEDLDCALADLVE